MLQSDRNGNILQSDRNGNIRTLGLSTGTGNCLLGIDAGSGLKSTSASICIGTSAGRYATTAYNFVCIGYEAGSGGTATAAPNNFKSVAIGHRSMANSVGLTDSICIGSQTAENLEGLSNVAIGSQALKGQLGQSSASNVTAVGYKAGWNILNGAHNNCIFGASAATSLTTGAQNCVIGALAGQGLTTENGNTLVGYLSGQYASTGIENTLIGTQCGRGSNGTSTFGRTTALGAFAGAALTTGSNNTLMGYATGLSATTSDSLALFGYMNNCAATGVSRSCALGSSNTINHSDCIVLGSSITTAAANALYLGSSTRALTTGTTSPSAGAAGALPATPAGYLTVYINGTARQMPYY